MRAITIVGNWKMNTTPSEAEQLASDIRLNVADSADATVVVCPPSIALESVKRVLDGSEVAIGVQNIHSDPQGAYTGEISAEMAREFASYAIVGHSERRALFDESDEFISQKVAAAERAGLRPILCVGEPSDVRSAGAGHAESFVTTQLLSGLSDVTDISSVLVAYEPVWAIGTGQAATPEVAQHIASALRSALRGRFGAAADQVPCLYGGSVNSGNIAEFVQQADIDGALVGGASLEAGSFADIVTAASRVNG
ncbi:MAG: triose-phosphate isomerase [Dehalococcoidia bacterium]|nr:triose-phosphate isomerase [Dehalococcoidia bacterium]